MALRFYLVPRAGSGTTPLDPFRPAFIFDMGVPLQAMDYGRDGTFLVGADVTPQQHADIVANAEAVALPPNLDAEITTVGARNQVQAALENLKLPAGWVTVTHTYRQVVGAVGRIFMVMQRFNGLHGRTFFELGITLDTRLNQLTVGQRQALIRVADDLGMDTSQAQPATTVRQVLKAFADQVGPFTLAGEVF